MATPEVKDQYSRDEVSKILKLSAEEFQQFEDEGVFEYLSEARKEMNRENFERLQSAVSLHRELGVNLPGIDIILSMKEKMSQLQTEFNDLLVEVQKKMGNQIKKDFEEIKSNLKSD